MHHRSGVMNRLEHLSVNSPSLPEGLIPLWHPARRAMLREAVGSLVASVLGVSAHVRNRDVLVPARLAEASHRVVQPARQLPVLASDGPLPFRDVDRIVEFYTS